MTAFSIRPPGLVASACAALLAVLPLSGCSDDDSSGAGNLVSPDAYLQVISTGAATFRPSIGNSVREWFAGFDSRPNPGRSSNR